jgi:hypothetical protein
MFGYPEALKPSPLGFVWGFRYTDMITKRSGRETTNPVCSDSLAFLPPRTGAGTLWNEEGLMTCYWMKIGQRIFFMAS